MMFKIENGRRAFYQWDLNQRLIVEDAAITEVHFSNMVTVDALVCEVYEEDGKRLVNVPNVLLQACWMLKVYGCCDNCVMSETVFQVISRDKPADYIYTEAEVRSYEDLKERIKKLEILIPTPDKTDVGKTLEVKYIGVDENAERVYGYRLTGVAQDDEPEIEIPMPDM